MKRVVCIVILAKATCERVLSTDGSFVDSSSAFSLLATKSKHSVLFVVYTCWSGITRQQAKYKRAVSLRSSPPKLSVVRFA